MQSRSHGLAAASLALCNHTAKWIIKRGSVSNQNCCRRFCFKEKVKKHCCTVYIERFINDGGGCMSRTPWSSLRIDFRAERGLPGPATRVLGGFGIRGHVAVGRTSLVIDLDATGRLLSNVIAPDRADALNGMLNVGAFHRGLQNEWLRAVTTHTTHNLNSNLNPS